jgi:hypothetical protein
MESYNKERNRKVNDLKDECARAYYVRASAMRAIDIKLFYNKSMKCIIVQQFNEKIY